MNPIPQEIKREGSTGLSITWRDGTTSHLSSEQLRRECPCAECKEKRGDTSHAKPLTGKKRSLAIVESTIAEETNLTEIWSIGQYALGIRWRDGHDSGIYTFEYLRELGHRHS
jgi:DUF971 family protein